jgi:intraflagellar transport protein 172
MWEETRQYGHAIDAYLNINQEHVDNPDDLEQIWKAAVKLAAQHQYQRYNEVATDVAGRLLKIEKYGSAADLFKEIEQPREALEAYMQGGLWEQARAISKAVPDERDRVEEEYQRHLMDTDNAGALVSTGNVNAGLDTFARQGKWEQVFEIASKEGHAVVGKYSAMYAKQLVGDGKDDAAVKVLHDHGAPPRPEHFNMYQDLAGRVLGKVKEDEDAADMPALSSMLRDVMFKLVASCKSLQITEGREKLEELLMAAHYFSLYHKIKEQPNMQMLTCKITITMLKYCTFLPADKFFYLAGEAAKNANNMNLSFVLQNRYIDLSEAIDDADMSCVDNSDFMDTNLPTPYDYPLPKQQYLNEAAHEDIREWLLQMGMDQKVDQSLPGKNDRSRAEEYDGMFPSTEPNCIVTGYPVPPSNRLEMKGWTANRKDWNLFVSRLKVDPWTGQPQKPMY